MLPPCGRQRGRATVSEGELQCHCQLWAISVQIPGNLGNTKLHPTQGGASPMIFWEEMRGSAAPPSYTEALNLCPPVRPSMPVQEREEPLKPKLCRMEKAPAGYGFHLNGIQGLCGQSIKEVRQQGFGSVAAKQKWETELESCNH